jgi:hypothetical protein
MGKLGLILVVFLSSFAATNHYVTVAGAGAKTGATWSNAKDTAKFIDRFDTAQPGDIFWLAKGTYTFLRQLNSYRGVDSCYQGTTAEPISVIGVKTGTTNQPPVYADWAIANTDRPTLSTENVYFVTCHQWILRNLIVNVNSTNGIDLGTFNTVENCKVTQTSVLADRYTITTETGCTVINCELSSPLGIGLWSYCGGDIEYNYIHDCQKGMFLRSDVFIGYNIISKCSFGICMNNTVYPSSGFDETITNNSFYACSTGIYGQHPRGGNRIKNNIFNCFTYDLSMDTIDNTMFISGNKYTQGASKIMLRGVDTSGISQDYLWSGGDPLFTNPGGGIFTLQSGSSCKNAGLKLELGTH